MAHAKYRATRDIDGIAGTPIKQGQEVWMRESRAARLVDAGELVLLQAPPKPADAAEVPTNPN